MADLETPDDLESIYLARGAEVGEYRPTFTGDIYRFADKHLAMILQHPCALRARVDLHPTLLAAPVSTDDRLRSKWSNAPFSKMPLPKLRAGQDYSADFVALEVIESAVLPDCERIAVLSQSGVKPPHAKVGSPQHEIDSPNSSLLRDDHRTV